MNVMKQKLFFLCIIFLATEIGAMKRQNPTNTPKARACKKQKIAVEEPTVEKPITYSFEWLSEDMQNVILDFCTKNTTAQTVEEACQTIRVLPYVNKKFNTAINNKNFSDTIIKTFSIKFNYSHEKIAQYLHTKQSQERLNLQNELKSLCVTATPLIHNPDSEKTLNLLIERGVDLNFTVDVTVDDKTLEKTPLMITVKNNLLIFELLVTKGALLNIRDINGCTVFNTATEYPISAYRFDSIENYVQALLNNSTLIIDQKNNRGETALLHCLINRQHNPITNVFLGTIKKLLDAGADPELADNDGYSPLEAAKKLNDKRTIDLIQNAIEKKYKQQK